MELLPKIVNVSREIVGQIDHRQTADAHGGNVIKDAHITANGEERSLIITIITIHPITIIIITTPAAAVAAPKAGAGKTIAARTTKIMEDVLTLRKKKRKTRCKW